MATVAQTYGVVRDLLDAVSPAAAFLRRPRCRSLSIRPRLVASRFGFGDRVDLALSLGESLPDDMEELSADASAFLVSPLLQSRVILFGHVEVDARVTWAVLGGSAAHESPFYGRDSLWRGGPHASGSAH